MRLALLGLGLAVALVACVEFQEASYVDLADADRDGATRRGWIPDWLPPSARTLREAHDLDTNQTVLSFRYDPAERFQIPGHCAPVKAAEVRQPPFKMSWWPKGVPPGPFVTPSHAFFSCGNGRAFLAVASSSGEAYYWRP
jgi:hypothetical protein